MILTCKISNPKHYYKLFFKVVKNPAITKELCKEILRQYNPFYGMNIMSSNEEKDLNFSYTSNMISFSVYKKELAHQIFNTLTKNKHLTSKIESKSITSDGLEISQYLVNSELIYPLKFRELFLKKIALNIYEKTGYIPKVQDDFLVIIAKDPTEMQKIKDALSQSGRVNIRLPGTKKMPNDKGEIVQVGQTLFSNSHGRVLFDKCVEKNKHVFIFLNNQILYELRMMFRLDKINHSVLYLECDGVIYGSFFLNERNLTRPEILLASFSDDLSTKNFIKKLRKPLPKLELYRTELIEKQDNLKIWVLFCLLSIALFLFLTKKKRRTIFFIISAMIFSSIIYLPSIGITHIKILSISSLVSLYICTFFTGFNMFIYNIFFVIVNMIFRQIFEQELVWNLFFSSTAQLIIYQSLAAFIYKLYNPNDKL